MDGKCKARSHVPTSNNLASFKCNIHQGLRTRRGEITSTSDLASMECKLVASDKDTSRDCCCRLLWHTCSLQTVGGKCEQRGLERARLVSPTVHGQRPWRIRQDPAPTNSHCTDTPCLEAELSKSSTCRASEALPGTLHNSPQTAEQLQLFDLLTTPSVARGLRDRFIRGREPRGA